MFRTRDVLILNYRQSKPINMASLQEGHPSSQTLPYPSDAWSLGLFDILVLAGRQVLLM